MSLERWMAALLLAAAAPLAARAAPPPWRPGDPVPSLAGAYRGDFLVGAAVGLDMIRSPSGRAFLERQFDVITPETELKPFALEPREGELHFGPADELVDWANRHGIKVRGHCLVWHQQELAWMLTDGGKPVSRELLARRLRRYIHDVVGHFKGRIWAWDVVNEALVAGEAGAEATGGWRPSGLYRVLGPEYVALAFQAAHEADPGALLFYNDYETQNPARRAMIVELVRSLRARGIRIDGIGHQSHYTVHTPPAAELEASIEELSRLGLRNSITEMDLTLRERLGAPVPPLTDALREEQARRWGEFFRMFRRNAGRIDAVVVWGVNDEASWLGAPDEPLLFSHFQPTAAFWAALGAARE